MLSGTQDAAPALDVSVPPRGSLSKGDREEWQRTSTLGLTVDVVRNLSSVVELVGESLAQRRRLLVTFVNPSSRAILKRRPNYARQLKSFDLVLPDGSGMVMALQAVHRLPASRISFDSTSLAPEVFLLAQNGGHTVALVGGRPGAADQAMVRLCETFPAIRFAGVFHGYQDIATRAAELAELDPDIIVCGMGGGAQEELLLEVARRGWQGCGFTCGGYLDQLDDGFLYYPRWVDRLNLRAPYRLCKEPRRLWRRYLIDYPDFFFALMKRLSWFARFGSSKCQADVRTLSPAARFVRRDNPEIGAVGAMSSGS